MDYPKSDPTARLLNDKFTDGDPVNGIPASRDSADYQNMVFDELINVISQAGLEPDEGNLSQVAAAVVALVGGTFDVRAWGQDDYVRIPDKPGGLIIQWGYVSSVGVAGTQVSFPVTFPNAFLSITGGNGASSGSSSEPLGFGPVGNITTSSFTIYSSANGDAAHWMAIGY